MRSRKGKATMKTQSPLIPGSLLDLPAYAAIVRECQWAEAQADLAAALRAPIAPKGDNVTSTIRPMRGAR